MKLKKSLLFASQLALGSFLFTHQTIQAQEEESTEPVVSLAAEDKTDATTSTENAAQPVEERDTVSENEGTFATKTDRAASEDSSEESKEEKEVRATYYDNPGSRVVYGAGQDRSPQKKGEAYTQLPKDVDYQGTLVDTHHTLDTLPWGVAGYKTIKGNLRDYARQAVRVSQEASTTRANWLKVTFEDGLTGWVDKVAIYKAEDFVSSPHSVNAKATLVRGSHTLDTRPYGTAGWRAIEGQVNERVGQKVQVKQTVKTTRASWAFVIFPDKTSGWIDIKALSPIEEERQTPAEYYTSSVKEESFVGKIAATKHTIDSLPWGIKGFKTLVNLRHHSEYLGSDVLVEKSVSTNRADWLYVNVVNKGISGWIDKKAIRITGEAFTSSPTSVDYYAKVTSSNHTLDSKPWGTAGFRTVRNRNQMATYLGKVAHVVQTVSTKRADWAFIKFSDGLNGWYDQAGLTQVEKPVTKPKPAMPKGEAYTSGVKSVNYQAIIHDANHTLDSQPWGTDGFETVLTRDELKAYKDSKVQVTKEVSTTRARWAYIQLNDGIAGWVDKAALNNGNLMNVPYISQLPQMPTGCEIVAATMMLQYAGVKITPSQLYNKMPHHPSDPNKGYVGNPYTQSGWTIFPPALTQTVRSLVGSAVDLTGCSYDRVIKQLNDFKPVVAWVVMHNIPNHAITLTGYKNNIIYYNDPITNQKNAQMTRNQFLRIWNATTYWKPRQRISLSY